jgi:hypothetical protein
MKNSLIMLAASFWLATQIPVQGDESSETAEELRTPIVLFSTFDVGSNLLPLVYDGSSGSYKIPAFTITDPSFFSQHPTDFMRYMPDVTSIQNRTVMGIVDSGVLTKHPVIRRALVGAIDLTGEGIEDETGHGTIVALLAAGVPPERPIFSIKTVGRDGTGTADTLIRAIEWAKRHGLTILNVSQGVYLPCKPEERKERDKDVSASSTHPRDRRSCENRLICQAVADAAEADVMVVAAVGNTPDQVACPACCLNALATGTFGFTNGADVIAPNPADPEAFFREMRRSQDQRPPQSPPP